MSHPTDLSYILNHLGEDRSQYFDAVIPPIVQSAMFAHPDVATMRRRIGDEFAEYVYTRGQNPTVAIVARKIAALEGAESALMFASGAAAMAAGALAVLRAGDEVLCVDKPYAWTRTLVKKHLAQFGVTSRLIDARSPETVAGAITDRTRLILLESPNSLTFEQQDLAAIAALAKARGIRTLLDNSFATPLGQSALNLGIDLVAHSATKYLNGHSDVVAGALCGSESLMREVFAGPYMTLGAILSPHDAWLLLRGLRTLPVRLKQIAETTAEVLDWLEQHPKVARVHSPWARQEPERFGLTERQLKHGNGLFSIELRAERIDQVETFVDGLKRFLIAASWGGYESLVFPVCGVRDWPSLDFPASVPVGLVRFSIGLESADVLIADLQQALDRV
ncbi:MAG: aminotransferase class V-fold PLP-dependent enzyme [Ahniella sp.]|nr:aminotransferase class V-fold PLP-dependent enzyme [Ahniella sp.]